MSYGSEQDHRNNAQKLDQFAIDNYWTNPQASQEADFAAAEERRQAGVKATEKSLAQSNNNSSNNGISNVTSFIIASEVSKNSKPSSSFPSSYNSTSLSNKGDIIHALIFVGVTAAIITLPYTGPKILYFFQLPMVPEYKMVEKEEPQAIEKPALKETASTTTQKVLIPTLKNDPPIKVKVSDYTPTGTTKVEMNDYQPTRPAITNEALDPLQKISNWLDQKPVDKSPVNSKPQDKKVRVEPPKNGGTTKVEVKKYQPNRPAITNAPINMAKAFG